MRLKTWFYLLVVPPMVLLLGLLGTTVRSAAEFSDNLRHLRGDGNAVVELHRFSAAIERETQRANDAIEAAHRAAGANPSRPSFETRAIVTDHAATRAAFARLDPVLRVDRAAGLQSDDDAESLIASADVALRAAFTQLDSAAAGANTRRFDRATEALRDAKAIVDDSLLSPVRRRLRSETREMGEEVRDLTSQHNAIIRLVTGRSADTRIDRIPVDHERLTVALEFTSAFHELAGEILNGDDTDASLTAARNARDASESLLADWDAASIPEDVQFAQVAMSTAVAAGDSAFALAEHSPSASAAIVSRYRSSFSAATIATVDTLPELMMSALQSDIGIAQSRASAVQVAVITLTVITICLALAPPIVLAQGVISPIVELTDASTRVADGELAFVTRAKGVGEVARLHRSFAQMTTRLASLAAARRQNERTLRESEARERVLAARLRHLLASGPAVVFNFTVETSPRITFISDNVLAQTGYDASRFIADPEFLASLVHPNDVALLFDCLRTAVDRERDSRELRVRMAGGSHRWLHLEVQTVCDDAGVPIEIVGWWMDVTRSRACESSYRPSGPTSRAISTESDPPPAPAIFANAHPLLAVLEQDVWTLDTALGSLASRSSFAVAS